MLEALEVIGREGNSQATPNIHRSPRSRRVTKAAFDYVIVVPALLLLAPLMIFIAFLIKLESPGPVFHRRRVRGRLGRGFNLYSFRTVYTNSNERLLENRAQWSTLLVSTRGNDDPRVTRTGKYLCRLGLDHLPFLFNILARDMSFVGPYFLTKKDRLYINRWRIEVIASELPGFTGLWQINNKKMSRLERAQLEIQYVRSWSLLLDIRILMATFSVLRQEPVT
ncbi:MAG: sugar transferase [Candidatus Promineifilaceae bacterium]|nr:sugar transferase [Candidatus Promineifilaceae bacterium]